MSFVSEARYSALLAVFIAAFCSCQVSATSLLQAGTVVSRTNSTAESTAAASKQVLAVSTATLSAGVHTHGKLTEQFPTNSDLKVGSSHSGSISQLLDIAKRASAKSSAHFLTNTELSPIDTVACLQAKQLNPSVNCVEGGVVVAQSGTWSGELSAGNFPDYKDPVCNSNGEYICDPHGMLDTYTLATLSDELRKLREATPVQCGTTYNKVDPSHYQPFYLGVVVLKEWPISQSSPDFLQTLGQIIAGKWNMNSLFTGDSQPSARCPNTGMLVVLPTNGQVYLSTDSCAFICGAKGGPEVTTAALAALRKGSAGNAALIGVQTAYNFLKQTASTDLLSGGANQVAAAGTVGAATGSDGQSNATLGYANTLQRAIWLISLVVLLFSLAVAFFVLMMAPGALAKGTRKR